MTEESEISSVAAALVETNDQLLGLYDLSNATSNSLDEVTVVTAILERASRIVGADATMLVTDAGQIGSGSRAGRAILESLSPESESSVTVVSATSAGGVDAELRVLRSSPPFTTGDRKLLAAVLRMALGGVETARLHDQAIRQALDAQDLRRAAEIAQLALPKWRPELAGVDLFARSDQARATGGDLFTFAVDDDVVQFAVGDVSGKGLTAAVMMTTVISATNAAFRDRSLDNPGSMLRTISEWTHDHLSEAGMFVTLFVGRYRSSDGLLEWSNAGHSPCMVVSSEGCRALGAQVPPIGVLEGISAPTATTSLLIDDIFVAATDGIVEQENTSGAAFGEARLEKVAMDRLGRPASDVGKRLLTSVEEFAEGSEQSDDRSVFIIRRDGGVARP